MKWQSWNFLLEIAQAFLIHKRVIILKARQLGLSWLVCAYCVWKALFTENALILLMSQGESDAWRLIDKCRFIISRLPPELKLVPEKDCRDELDFPIVRSQIKALASTERAGAGVDATLVVRDEADFHPYAEENYRAIGPAIDGGGQLIELSTRNPEKTDTHFQMKFKMARAGQNTFYPVFLGRFARPIRDEDMTLDEWWEQTKKNYPNPLDLAREYPLTEEEALSLPQTILYFDLGALSLMQIDAVSFKPIEGHSLTKKFETIKVYKDYRVGGKYVLFTDPSDGFDPHASVVVDWQTGEEVANSHGKLPVGQVTLIHDALVRHYSAYNSFESNARAGGAMLERIKELQTPFQHYQLRGKDAIRRGKKPVNEQPGWYTSGGEKGSNLRDTMLSDLRAAVAGHLIRIHEIEAISEMKQFIQVPGKKAEASENCNDDWVMAWAGVYQLIKYMPLGNFTITSTKYKD